MLYTTDDKDATVISVSRFFDRPIPELPSYGAGSPTLGRPITERRTNQLIWAVLIVGIVARLVRYSLRFPLWDDETFLMANLIDANYSDISGSLDFCQISPFGFLWTELTCAKLFGFNEYALRLPSLICGIGSLLLFRHVAGRVVRGVPLLMAVALFAGSYPMIRYSAEAKPYGLDLFFALVIIGLLIEWWHDPRHRTRWLWAMAAAIGPIMLISYPNCFVGGGVSLFLGFMLFGHRQPDGQRRLLSSSRLAWLSFNVLMLAGFATVYTVSIVPQTATELDFMRNYWVDAFPPLSEPLMLIPWFLRMHCGQMMAYPVGDKNFASSLTFLMLIAGLVVMYRRQGRYLAAMLLAPLAVTMLAAAMHRYPYGVAMRMNIYMAPAFCLIIGIGIAGLIGPRKQRGMVHSRRAVVIIWCILLAVPLASIARDIRTPTKAGIDLRFRDFSRWFWFEMEQESEVVCLKSDLGLNFSPEVYKFGFSAMYLCNQRIYSPRHIRGEEPQWGRISKDRPLRCVQYRVAGNDKKQIDQAALDAWLAEMQKFYVLTDQHSYPFTFYNKQMGYVRERVCLDVFEFVPRDEIEEPVPLTEIQAPTNYPGKTF